MLQSFEQSFERKNSTTTMSETRSGKMHQSLYTCTWLVQYDQIFYKICATKATSNFNSAPAARRPRTITPLQERKLAALFMTSCAAKLRVIFQAQRTAPQQLQKKKGRPMHLQSRMRFQAWFNCPRNLTLRSRTASPFEIIAQLKRTRQAVG